MKFQPNDIFTRRERDGRLCIFVHQDWLVENIKGLTERNLRVKYRALFMRTVRGARRRAQKVLPDTGAAWRFAKTKHGFYYDYERLPEQRLKGLPEVHELQALYDKAMASNAQSAMEADLLEYLKDVHHRYLHAYTDCTDDQARNLTRACGVIQFGATDISSREPTRCNDYYRHLSGIIAARSWTYLPTHYRRLKDKIMEVVEGAKVTDVITLPRKGNNNRSRYDDAQVIAWIMYLRSRPENYSGAYIARKVIAMCHLALKPAPSFSWVEHYLANNKTKFLTGGARHRSGRKGAGYKDYIPVQGALYAGDCWQMDGTRINFIPHKSEDGSEKSLMIIAVRDVHSGDIVGMHFDTKEDRYGYIHAMNMAVASTGHLPYELVHDRFPGHNTDEWTLITKRLEREGVKVTVSSTATGKSHVERCFSTLQDVFMQDFPWYYGQGIMSNREAAHRSPEYIAKVKKRARREGWDFNAAWQAASSVVERYRATPLSDYSRKYANVEQSPKQLYEQSDKLNAIACEDFTRVELFGTMRSATIRNNGLIRMRIHQAEYVYRIDDYEVIAGYKKVNVYYDLEDLSKIYLFAPGDEVNSHFLGEIQEEKAVAYYGPDADMKRLAKMKEARKKVHQQRQQELEALVGEVNSEVELLMGALTDKVSTDDAQTRWLEERVNVWQDKGATPRMDIPATTPQDEEEEEEAFVLDVIRNY